MLSEVQKELEDEETKGEMGSQARRREEKRIILTEKNFISQSSKWFVLT